MGIPYNSPGVLADSPPFSTRAITRSWIDVTVSHHDENDRTCSLNQRWHLANNGTFTFVTVFLL
jgi:hypothetical protein